MIMHWLFSDLTKNVTVFNWSHFTRCARRLEVDGPTVR